MHEGYLKLNFSPIKKRGITYLKYQRQQLATYGVAVFLLKKSYRVTVRLLLVTLSLPLIVAIRMVRPFMTIRLGQVLMDRLGNPYHVEWYLCEKDVGKLGKGNVDIYYFTETCSNPQWFKMIKRNLRIFPFGKLAQMVDKLNQELLGYDPHFIPKIATTDILANKNDVLLHRLNANLHYHFTPEEEIRGRNELSEIVPEDQTFICFHIRDSAYLDTVHPNLDWSYHNFRDSSLHNYLPAVEQLVQRGYSTVRMGAVVKEKLITTNPGIINYAENGKRSDFMDIYLSAKCVFFLGS